MARTLWEIRLGRLRDKVEAFEDKLKDKVENAYRKMTENPHYDSYADLSAASEGLSDPTATIEGIKKYEPITPKGISSQRLQDEVANVLEMVECTRKRMLQDSSYKAYDDLAFIVKRLDDLYIILEGTVERIERGEE